MKKRALVLAAVVALTVMSSTRAVHAQEACVVNIPFDFVAGDRIAFQPENTPSMSRARMHTLLLIDRNVSLTSPFLTPTRLTAQPKSNHNRSSIFNRYGHRYFLSLIWGCWRFSRTSAPKISSRKRNCTNRKS